jgi:diguanylate cyclase (GGDEF)-like protein
MTPEPHSEQAHSSPVAEQLERGFRWLRFEAQLENEYQREQYEHGLDQLRLNIVLAIGLVLAFMAIDRMVLPDAGPVASLLRYGVVLPALAACLGVTFIPHSWRLFRRLASWLAPVTYVAVVALVLSAGVQGSQTIFPAVILAAIFIYYLVGLSFYGAVRTNLVGLATFIVGASLVDIPAQQTSYQALVLLIANLAGATVAYSFEIARRAHWLEARLLAEMAERDGLTRIYNRRRLDGHLRRVWQQGIREQCPMALLMIDIDGFKAFNDLYGHQAGDEALKSVAGVLVRAARRPLDLVGRYGGEEFLIVLYDTTREYAAELAQKTLEGVRELRIPHGSSNVAPVLTVSVGVAYAVPQPGRSADGLLQLADEALYVAKHGGRNRIHVMEAADYAKVRTGTFRVANR